MRRKVGKQMAALVCSAALFTSMPVSAMDYYETSNGLVIAPDRTLSVRAEDGEGNPLEGGSYILYNSEGRRVASWDGNAQDSLSSGYNPFDGVSDGTVTVWFDEMPDLTADKGTLRQISYVSEDGDSGSLYEGGGGPRQEYGMRYTASYEYIPYEEPTDLVVPAGTVYLTADSGWASKTYLSGIDLEGFDGDSGVYFNDFAGSFRTLQVPAGNYQFYTRYAGAGGGSLGYMLPVSDKETYYVKKRFRLSEMFPFIFNADCTSTKEFFGTEYTIDVRKDDTDRGCGMNLVFRSGSVVTAALPDADGYVEIYVEKGTCEAYISTDYIYAGGSGSGGGIGSLRFHTYSTEDHSYSIWSPPEDMVSMTELYPDTYTLHQKSAPIGRKLAEDITFTIEEENAAPVLLPMVSDWEDYSISLIQPKHGSIQANAETFHYQETAQFEAVPDLYYELDHFIAARGSGEILELEADECSLLMPAENVAVTAVFRCTNGDVNGDNEIDATDASLVLICAAREGAGVATDLTTEQHAQADFNNDGTVDASDASMVLQYSAKQGVR